jgi:predicted RNase H-like HicB family nuclease
MKTYLAYVYKDPNSSFGVSFPDLPGCYGVGESYDEAIENARESLREYAQALSDDDKDMPKPRTHGELASNATEAIELNNAAFVIEVPLITAGSKRRINVSMDNGIIAAIDRFVKLAGTTRSAFLAELAFERMQESMRLVRTVPKAQRKRASRLVTA